MLIDKTLAGEPSCRERGASDVHPLSSRGIAVSQVVQFTGPRKVEVAEFSPPELPPDHVRVRTRYSGISAGTELTAYRGTNPYLTRSWDPSERLFSEGASGIEYPVTGWGYSEVGVVVEIGPDAAGTPGLPDVGDLVWGIWGHRSEAVLPASRIVGRRLPRRTRPARGHLRPRRRRRPQCRPRRRPALRRGRRGVRPGRARPARDSPSHVERRHRRRGRRDAATAGAVTGVRGRGGDRRRGARMWRPACER